ncbi:MAG: hypothetical protein ACLTMP_01260 [Eggerthella lenta]
MKRLVELEYACQHQGRQARRRPRASYVWDVLEEVITEHPVLLNRAPTLHRLGIRPSSRCWSRARPSSCTRWSAPPSTPTSTATR